MDVLAVIPARAGSKGVPGKNTRQLGGRPLLAYSCGAAGQSRYVTRTIVSTDDEAIADVARASGAEVPFLRPAALAADDTPMIDVLVHALATLRQTDGYVADVVVLLQPTSPLRTAAHVDAALTELLQTDADSVVSVVEVPHAFSPVSVMQLVNDRLLPYAGAGQAPTRRQDKPRVYARNGPAVLAVRSAVLERGSLYGDHIRPLIMAAEDSVDIDTPFDFELAAWLLARRETRR